MQRTLSDTHRVVLANAAAKVNLNALPVPSTIGNDPEKISKVLAELLEDGLLAEVPKSKTAKACGSYSGSNADMLITNRGLLAIGISPLGDEGVSLVELKSDGDVPHARGSKLQMLVTLLQRPQGARIDELVLATGWQKRSVRGAMSGALKKHSHQISSVLTKGRGRVYRIEMTGPPPRRSIADAIARTADEEAQK